MTTDTVHELPAVAASPKAKNLHPELIAIIEGAGLIGPRALYYTLKITGTLLVFFAVWAAFVLIGASWWNIGVTAGLLAVMSTQVAFIGHDAGHKQIFGKKKANTRLGMLLGDLLNGMAIGWWVPKHNAHHAFPNVKGKDPDAITGALTHDEEEAKARGRAGQWLARNQAYLFFPMLLLEGFNLQISSFQALFDATIRSKRERKQERILLLVHLVLYLAAVFYVLTPVQAFVFIAVHQALFGLYMGISFAPNHKGMPLMDENSTDGYVQRQVLTARGIKGGRTTDLLLGGLNYQAVHHLFPNMARPFLRLAEPHVRDFCKKYDIEYTVVSFWRSYYEVLKHLHGVGRELRRNRRARKADTNA